MMDRSRAATPAEVSTCGGTPDQDSRATFHADDASTTS
jgi:hypothetical protein